MTEENPASSSSAARLNEYQARRVRAICQYIDRLFGDIDGILNREASKAAFPRFASDISPVQRRTIQGYIEQARAQLVRVLEGQSILKEKPVIPASRAIHVTLGAIDNAAEELKPKYMRGYGDVPASAATELNGSVVELQTLVRRLDQYLSENALTAGTRR